MKCRVARKRIQYAPADRDLQYHLEACGSCRGFFILIRCTKQALRESVLQATQCHLDDLPDFPEIYSRLRPAREHGSEEKPTRTRRLPGSSIIRRAAVLAFAVGASLLVAFSGLRTYRIQDALEKRVDHVVEQVFSEQTVFLESGLSRATRIDTSLLF